MDLSKLSTADLQALKAGDLSKVSTAGLQALKAGSMEIPDDVRNEAGLQADPFSVITLPAKRLGQMTEAGGAGIGNLVAGNGLEQAASDVNKVDQGGSADTTSGSIGKFAGSLVTPAQIALQGGLGAALEGLGPWVTDVLKGWSENAAVNAVGKLKNIAKSIGIQNLDSLGKFLLSPVKIGEQELPAVVTATSSPTEMLSAVQAIKQAAGKQLGVVSNAVDDAIKTATGMGGDAPVAIDLAGLQDAVTTLKTDVESVAPNLGKAVVNQYSNAIKDINNLIKQALEGDSTDVFSKLSELKTTIGDLVYKHGSPLESKAALQDVYKAISKTLDDAAQKVGGATGAAYDQANAVYHQAVAVESALEGKVVDAAKWFDAPSFLAAMTAGFATHGPAAAVTVPATYMGAKLAQNYGPQAIAAGLDASAPFMSSALKAGLRAIPVVGNGIVSALTDNQ